MLPAAAASRIALLVASPDGDVTPERSSITRCATLFLFGILTLALHARAISGSISSPRTRLDGGVATTKRHDGHEDPRMEFTQKLGAAASAVALSIGGVAGAQDAVQWRVEDGGNGHWYARNNVPLTWEQAIASAQARGGALATTTSSAELAFIGVHLISDGMMCWLGGTIDCAGATGPCCDDCAWRWTSGEPFNVAWTGWIGDNDYTTERLVTNGVGFDDMCSPCVVQDYRPPSIIEWSADCNNDGVVDYGQIRSGQLPDVNGNGIPDGCDSNSGQYSPIQWAVNVGGNGHWYQPLLTAQGIGWTAARSEAVARGGDLACAETAAERIYFFQSFTATAYPSAWTPQAQWTEANFGPWLGGTQLAGSPEPLGGWTWVTGSGFDPTELGCCDNVGCAGPEDRLHLLLVAGTVTWNDLPDTWSCGSMPRSLLIEWSADCNNDGIIDFGQIRAGELEDANGNNIPDDCEKSAGDPYGPQQWTNGNGGNGHWYQVITPGALTWTTARGLAEDRGGQLACAESVTEKQFIMTRFGFQSIPNACTPENGNPATQYGPWIGGYQEPESIEPIGGWRWLTGNYFDPTEAECCNNSGCAGAEDRLHLYWRTDIGQTWNDAPNQPSPCSSPISYLVEWSADCNNDGIVDFGQIRAGELEDANGNNVPDCCEGGPSCNCPADIARDGFVNGIDLAAVLNNWGSPGGAFNADINDDGFVDGADLAEVLNSWGPCP